MLWNGFGNFEVEYDPFQRLKKLHEEVNRLFEGGYEENTAFPSIDVKATDNEITLVAELPGMEPSDLDISVLGQTLTLKGNRKEEPQPETNYYRRERSFGEFTRIVKLPYPVNMDHMSAEYANGLLRIKLQRAEADKPRKIVLNKEGN